MNIGVLEDSQMSKITHPRIGLIAEDDSDVDAAIVLIKRITGNNRVGMKKFVGKGCGRIKRKCRRWTKDLKQKGCQYLILLHDLDNNNLEQLRSSIEDAISPSPIQPYLICVPIEEMEAWWLADTSAIKKALNLKKFKKIKGDPEQLKSPKEMICDLVRQFSNKEKKYLNTVHNKSIAEHLNLTEAKKKCASFNEFFVFVSENIK